jgi:hypothetical protein
MIWSQWLEEKLLEQVPHRMFTLTVPKRIRPFFLWDRKLLALLARSASETIKRFYQEMTGQPDAVPGIVLSVQTFGNRAANYHPHIHCLVTDGAFLPDDSFVSASFLPPVDISELFRRTVLKAFVERNLISQVQAENMLSWPHSGFHVHLGPLIHPDQPEELKATARYCARAPLALSRLSYHAEQNAVSYTYTNPYDHTERTERITPEELIARLATHLPDPWEHLTRYYGFYSNRTRGARSDAGTDAETDGEGQETIVAAKPPPRWKKQWTELLQLVFEVTLNCPRCGAEMNIISFITDHQHVDKILRHLRAKGIDARAGPFEATGA